MAEFKGGDWVRIVNKDPLHLALHGKTGFVGRRMDNSTTTMYWVLINPEGGWSVWSPESLEYLGTEHDFVKSVLGEDYFHG